MSNVSFFMIPLFIFKFANIAAYKILTLSSPNVKRQSIGGMAEWFKAAVLKTVVRKYRGFESYFLRQIWRGDREADGVRLLSECGG